MSASNSQSATQTQAPPLAIDLPQAARALGLSPRTVHKLTRSNELPHIRVGRRVLYTFEELRVWLASRTKGASR